MGLEKLKGLKKGKIITTALSLSDKQTIFLRRELAEVSEDEIWKESSELKSTFTISFIELGRRLKELQERYAKNGNGNFQKTYIDKGFRKTEVQTLISKFEIYEEAKKFGRDATELNLIADSLQDASQKTTAEIKKAPEEVKEMFYTGTIKSLKEIKEASEAIIEAEIIEEPLKKIDIELVDKTALINEKKELRKRMAELTREMNDIADKLSNIDLQLENVNNLKLVD